MRGRRRRKRKRKRRRRGGRKSLKELDFYSDQKTIISQLDK